jgi:hypothetical protein
MHARRRPLAHTLALPLASLGPVLVACGGASPPRQAEPARSLKHIVDVSLRKEPTPHGTGFAVLDPRTHQREIVTAAHVVFWPDRLDLTTKGGQTGRRDSEALNEERMEQEERKREG